MRPDGSSSPLHCDSLSHVLNLAFPSSRHHDIRQKMESGLEVLGDRLSLQPGSERSNNHNNSPLPFAARPSHLGGPTQPTMAQKSELNLESDQLRPSSWAGAQTQRQVASPFPQQTPQHETHGQPVAKGAPSTSSLHLLSAPNQPGLGSLLRRDPDPVSNHPRVSDSRLVSSLQPMATPSPLRDSRMQSIAPPEQQSMVSRMPRQAEQRLQGHSLQNYQRQVTLLEQANMKRLIRARQDEELGRQTPMPITQASIPEGAPAPNLEEKPAQEEAPQPHYTISEDEVTVGQWKNLAGLKPSPDLPQALQLPAQSSTHPIGVGESYYEQPIDLSAESDYFPPLQPPQSQLSTVQELQELQQEQQRLRRRVQQIQREIIKHQQQPQQLQQPQHQQRLQYLQRELQRQHHQQQRVELQLQLQPQQQGTAPAAQQMQALAAVSSPFGLSELRRPDGQSLKTSGMWSPSVPTNRMPMPASLHTASSYGGTGGRFVTTAGVSPA